MTTTALQKYQVCVTTTGFHGSIALYDVEGWLSKDGVLVPIYDGGKTYQDESPYATVTLIEDTTLPDPANTITFDEMVGHYPPCTETARVEGQSNVLLCRLFEGHDGNCEWVSF
jgi:hypothetical protein